MTSSWFGRQGALHAIFHDGFWKNDHNFLIVFHSNCVSGMHGFWDNKVLLQAGYDVIVISSLGGAPANFHDGLWKSDNNFLIALQTNFWSRMHSFRDNEVLMQPGYDHDFLTTFYTNFLSRMHGFRDNEVLLWSHRDFSTRGGFRPIFMTDSGRATLTSW